MQLNHHCKRKQKKVILFPPPIMVCTGCFLPKRRFFLVALGSASLSFSESEEEDEPLYSWIFSWILSAIEWWSTSDIFTSYSQETIRILIIIRTNNELQSIKIQGKMRRSIYKYQKNIKKSKFIEKIVKKFLEKIKVLELKKIGSFNDTQRFRFEVKFSK